MNQPVDPIPFYGNTGKLIGFTISLIGAMIILADQLEWFSFPYSHFVILTGLLTIAYSKEEIESDSIVKLRYGALKAGFTIMFVVLLASQATWAGMENVAYETLLLVPYFGISIYLLIFNLQLLTKTELSENYFQKKMRRSPKFYLIYTLALIFFVMFITILP